MTPFALMDEEERLAFGGLLRLMVRMDGEFSKEEVVALTSLGTELGADIWGLLNESALLERAELVEMLDELRPELRRWVYGTVQRIAEADGIDESEHELLDWLRLRWNL